MKPYLNEYRDLRLDGVSLNLWNVFENATNN